MTTHTKTHSILLLIITISIFSCKPEQKPASQNQVLSSAIQEENNRHSAIDSVELISEIQSDTVEVSSVSLQKKPTEEKSKLEEVENTRNKKATTKVTKKTKPKPRAKIEFEELTWDFGEITEGDVVSKKFKFTNTGKGPLQILATSASCGCTTPSFPFLDIDPGESNVIGVTYNSVGKEGQQNPEITVESNTSPRITTIKLKGVVNPKKKKDPAPSLVKDTTQIDH